MKLILTREVSNLGAPGDIVEVADGYGRNFLVPRGDAIGWTRGAEKQIVQIKRARDSREIRDVGHSNELKAALAKLTVTLEARAGKDGKLFGSVTSGDVVNAIKAAGGPTLDKKSVDTSGHIKNVGEHTVSIDLSHGVSAAVPITVTAS